jgi:hypothetical protein
MWKMENVMRSDVFWQTFKNFSVYHTRESCPSPAPTPNPPTATVHLDFNWLGVDLEVRSLCYRPTP